MQLKGLILSGGKSERMNEDKASLSYHTGKDQLDYNIELLSHFCDEVFVSCTIEQKNERLKKGYNLIIDSYPSAGPTTGILSAQSLDPDSAWLVLACDLPYLDEETIRELVKNRNSLKNATAYMNPIKNWPEPLCTIYEPSSFKILESYFLAGKTCPRKVLFNSDIKELTLKNQRALDNVNTPAQREEAISFFNNEGAR